MNNGKRVIMHLDMDHFYTAVEERRQPELRGKPVVVGADPKQGKGRGVVYTSNYEARRCGVRSGMPISRAWKMCPSAIYLPPDFKEYVNVSTRIMGILRGHADKFEQWGIDEAFLDVSSRVKSPEDAETLARHIKKEIQEVEGLTCSIGIGPNKIIAKTASDFHKPDGLTIVKDEEAEAFLAPLPVRKLLWVGRKTEQRLAAIGIRTIGDLAHHDPTVLRGTFGVIGNQLYLMAHGIDSSEVEEKDEVKSISRETTFEEDTSDYDLVLNTSDKLSEEIHHDVTTQKLLFKTVTVKVRYENFETHTHSKTLPSMTNREQDLEKAARELIRPYFKSGKRIRLIGVRVSTFMSAQKQTTLQ